MEDVFAFFFTSITNTASLAEMVWDMLLAFVMFVGKLVFYPRFFSRLPISPTHPRHKWYAAAHPQG